MRFVLDFRAPFCSFFVLMSSPAPLPAIRAERCVIYCMSCGRSTTAATYVVEGLFGWLPYGRVTNRLHCRKGCGDRFGMVLPVDAPTPRLFAQRYDLAPEEPVTKPQFKDRDLEADCRDRIVEVGEGGSFLKVHAKSQDPAIVHWGFDYLLKKFSNQWRGPPHLIVARGTQWSRDSKRDYKVVGGKFVERTGDDPDEEEDGIG
jgi:hypothetical protein